MAGLSRLRPAKDIALPTMLDPPWVLATMGLLPCSVQHGYNNGGSNIVTKNMPNEQSNLCTFFPTYHYLFDVLNPWKLFSIKQYQYFADGFSQLSWSPHEFPFGLGSLEYEAIMGCFTIVIFNLQFQRHGHERKCLNNSILNMQLFFQ